MDNDNDIFNISDEDFDELRANEIVRGWFGEFDRGLVMAGLSVEVVAQRFKYTDELLGLPNISEEIKASARARLMDGELLRTIESSSQKAFQLAYQRTVALTVWTARYMVLAICELIPEDAYRAILQYSADNNEIEKLIAYATENGGVAK